MDNQTPQPQHNAQNGTTRNDALVAIFKANKIKEILDGARDDAKKKKTPEGPTPQ